MPTGGNGVELWKIEEGGKRKRCVVAEDLERTGGTKCMKFGEREVGDGPFDESVRIILDPCVGNIFEGRFAVNTREAFTTLSSGTCRFRRGPLRKEDRQDSAAGIIGKVEGFLECGLPVGGTEASSLLCQFEEGGSLDGPFLS